MQVTSNFNNLISYKPQLKENSAKTIGLKSEPAKDEVTISRFKKASSECRYVVIAAGIFYFALKKLFRAEEITNYAIDRFLKARKIPPNVKLPA